MYNLAVGAPGSISVSVYHWLAAKALFGFILTTLELPEPAKYIFVPSALWMKDVGGNAGATQVADTEWDVKSNGQVI